MVSSIVCKCRDEESPPNVVSCATRWQVTVIILVVDAIACPQLRSDELRLGSF